MTHPIYLFIKDALTFIFTLAGLVVAGLGLATWKKQIKGTKEFETAYNLNYSVLKLRDAIKHVRHPAIVPSENYQAEQYSKTKYPDKLPEDTTENSHVYVYEMRWDEITKASTEMESHLIAAEVLWSSEISNLIKPLNEKITELNINLLQYFQPKLRTKDYMEIYSIVYGFEGDEKDVFAQKVKQAVQAISDYLKKYL